MDRKYNYLALVMSLLAGFVTNYGQTAQAVTGNWVDYASADYDIQPNVTYAVANNTDLKLDLYLPKDKSKPSPTLVLFHGGGWVDGAKERNIFYLLPYLSMGWTVVNVEYRLARNSLAPAAVEDSRCSLRWLTYHAKEYNIDTNKVVLTGTSAGAHLSLISAMLPAGNQFDRQCPTDPSTKWRFPTEPVINVAAVVDWSGIADVAGILEGPSAKHYAMEWLGSRDDRMELARQLSPVNYIRAGLPPIISIHGDADDIAPYAATVKLHDGLEKAKVPHKLITLKGKGHGGYSQQDMVSSYAEIRDFLRRNGIL